MSKLKDLLKEAHDLMDDANVSKRDERFLCQWCKSQSWNSKIGIWHSNDCILKRIRAVKGIKL